MRKVSLSIENWPFAEPFVITGHTFENAAVLLVEISDGGYIGRGEASGVYYLHETATSMLRQAESVKECIEAGASREDLLTLLPAGGARNALDCALWDLEAKRKGETIWNLTGLDFQPVQTVNTVGIGTPAEMAAKAATLTSRLIKIKLDADLPYEKVSAIRQVRPDATLVVDVNQGWSFNQLVELAPKFKALNVAMIEQPLPRGADEILEEYCSPLPLCADESCLDTSEFEQAAKRYQMINIKLDKTGGLTEALALARLAKSRGLGLMVGNMLGTSLAMAPGLVIAQLCDLVDLDGPLLINADREYALHYEQSLVGGLTPQLWG